MQNMISRARELAKGTGVSDFDRRWPLKTVPEMAELLEKMAEELEERDRWAQSMCKAFCIDWKSRGRHAPNCPVEDWGLK